jgi:hypothetical protein
LKKKLNKCRRTCRWNMSVGIRQRVEKNLQPMPQSLTAHPLVIYRWHCRQPISVGILQRVLKYLRPMPPSPTDWPSVIYRWKYRWNTSVDKVLAREIFYGCAFLVCKTVGVCFFSDKHTDGSGNYRWSIFWQTYSVDETVGKNFTDELCVLHWHNYSIGKTV